MLFRSVLEFAASLPAAGWSTVTNAVATIGNRLSVTLDTDAAQRFYRLRKPGVMVKLPPNTAAEPTATAI